MQYIPQYKQKEKKLILQQKIFPEESEQYKILGIEIEKEKKLKNKYKNKDHLTLHKIDKINQKYIINALEEAIDDLSLKVIKSAITGIGSWFKKKAENDI